MTARMLQMSGIVVDLLYAVDAVPLAGEEAVVRGFDIQPGGGFNAMVAARRAGMDVSYGGGLGRGPFARIVRDGLNAEAIPVLRPQDTTRDQGCCTVLVDPSGERTFVASEGAEGHATDDDIAHVTGHRFDWTLLSGYGVYYPGARDAVTRWLLRDEPIAGLVFDPAPIVASLPPEALAAARARATWVSANLREAAVMTGLSDPVHAARALAQDRPADGGAIVRDGRRGCVVATADTCEWVDPFPVDPIDTNGAGDTHLGSFVARLGAGETAVEAARYANVAAALSTTRRGPATAPDKHEVIAALNQRRAG